MNLSIAPARPGDSRALARIMLGWTDETSWMPQLHTLDGTDAFLAGLILEMQVTTARNVRGPHGFLARDGETVHALYLAPKARGKGVGKRLIDRAKEETGRLTLWTFQANIRARAFYAREGFREVELTDGAGNDERLPDVRLTWSRETET